MGWSVDRYMGQDSAHGLECGQIYGSGLSAWAGVWTDTWVRTQHMGWGVDRYMGQDSAHGLGCGQIWNTVDVLTNILGKVQMSA